MKRVLLTVLLSIMCVFALAIPPLGNNVSSQQKQDSRVQNTQVSDRYGSVSMGLVDNKIVFGWGSNQRTEKAAKALALKNCQAQGAQDCGLESYVRNGCIAIMDRHRPDGVIVTIADWEGSITGVKKKIQKKCEASDRKCEIIEVQCSADEKMKHVWGK